ncbi:MAG: prepilin-type N-terminal cleavage/methylation domain-containing protein [Planctomycetota bacterium]
MKISRPSPRRGLVRKGLTLIELLVVLTILIALGGLLIPVVGNALTRSHVATCSASIPEIANMLNTQIATRGTIGDGWATGINGGAAVNDTINDPANDTLDTQELTGPEIDALAGLGITTLYDHGTPATVEDYNVTFNNGVGSPAGAGQSAAIVLATDETTGAATTTTDVIVLSAAQAAQINLPAANGEKYIWLGLDKEWDLLGTATPEMPVHFGDTPGAYPQEVYSRFGAVIKIAENNDADPAVVEALPTAQFARISYSLDGENFETADNHIAIFWQEVFE